MSMKSIEDLERVFDRGIACWEGKILSKSAERMGAKCVRELKRNTKVVTGNLKRRWGSRTEVKSSDIKIHLTNDADYAAYVNDGHRIKKGGKTVGYFEGHHMLEKGVAAYKTNYLKDDLQGMVDELGKAMKG